METAVAMSKRILSQSGLMGLLLEADESTAAQDSPFNSYTKLQVILNKTKSPRNLEWCLFGLHLVVRFIFLLHMINDDKFVCQIIS